MESEFRHAIASPNKPDLPSLKRCAPASLKLHSFPAIPNSNPNKMGCLLPPNPFNVPLLLFTLLIFFGIQMGNVKSQWAKDGAELELTMGRETTRKVGIPDMKLKAAKGTTDAKINNQDFCAKFLVCERQLLAVHRRCTEQSRMVIGHRCNLDGGFRELAKLGDARMEELGSCLLAEGGKGENDGGSAQGCAEGGRKLTIGQQRNESCWQMLAKLKKECQATGLCCKSSPLCLRQIAQSNASLALHRQHQLINRRTMQCRRDAVMWPIDGKRRATGLHSRLHAGTVKMDHGSSSGSGSPSGIGSGIGTSSAHRPNFFEALLVGTIEERKRQQMSQRGPPLWMANLAANTGRPTQFLAEHQPRGIFPADRRVQQRRKLVAAVQQLVAHRQSQAFALPSGVDLHRMRLFAARPHLGRLAALATDRRRWHRLMRNRNELNALGERIVAKREEKGKERNEMNRARETKGKRRAFGVRTQQGAEGGEGQEVAGGGREKSTVVAENGRGKWVQNGTGIGASSAIWPDANGILANNQTMPGMPKEIGRENRERDGAKMIPTRPVPARSTPGPSSASNSTVLPSPGTSNSPQRVFPQIWTAKEWERQSTVWPRTLAPVGIDIDEQLVTAMAGTTAMAVAGSAGMAEEGGEDGLAEEVWKEGEEQVAEWQQPEARGRRQKAEPKRHISTTKAKMMFAMKGQRGDEKEKIEAEKEWGNEKEGMMGWHERRGSMVRRHAGGEEQEGEGAEKEAEEPLGGERAVAAPTKAKWKNGSGSKLAEKRVQITMQRARQRQATQRGYRRKVIAAAALAAAKRTRNPVAAKLTAKQHQKNSVSVPAAIKLPEIRRSPSSANSTRSPLPIQIRSNWAELEQLRRSLIRQLEKFIRARNVGKKGKSPGSAPGKDIKAPMESLNRTVELQGKNLRHCQLFSACRSHLRLLQSQKCPAPAEGRLVPGPPKRRFGRCNSRLLPLFERLDSVRAELERKAERCVADEVARGEQEEKSECHWNWPPLPPLSSQLDCPERIALVLQHCRKLGRCCSSLESCQRRVDSSGLAKRVRLEEQRLMRRSARCQLQAQEMFRAFREMRRKQRGQLGKAKGNEEMARLKLEGRRRRMARRRRA